MSSRVVFEPYRPKTILNQHKHTDHWFWTRYSAHPYVGCQHGCAFCYCRERKFAPYEDPHDFARVIKVKENAPELLHRALSRAKVDLLMTGDYQPAEQKFRVSRRMLEVCRELGFPVMVLERSPLVLQDMDLLRDIREKAACVIAFSMISSPDSPNASAISRMEHLTPLPGKRLAAMESFAKAGFLTGVCFMPILPGLCDDDRNLQAVTRCTADHGGRFLLAGGLTLADQQRDFFLDALGQRHAELLGFYRALYGRESYAPHGDYWPKIGLRIRELCEKHGIRDRMPRPVIPGDKYELNKRIVERLADRTYEMELSREPSHLIWSHRKAAWAIEELEQDIGLIYRAMGRKGLQGIPDVGPDLGETIETMLVELGHLQSAGASQN